MNVEDEETFFLSSEQMQELLGQNGFGVDSCDPESVNGDDGEGDCDEMEQQQVTVTETIETNAEPVSVPPKKFRSTKRQLNWLDYRMNEDSGKNSGTKWDVLSNELNQLGPARSIENWKRVWTGRKYLTKKQDTEPYNPEKRPKFNPVLKTVLADSTDRSSKFAEGDEEAKSQPQIHIGPQKPDNSVCACGHAIESSLPLVLNKLDMLTSAVKECVELLKKLVEK